MLKKIFNDMECYSMVGWLDDYLTVLSFPGGANGKEPACQSRRFRFDPWVREIPWRTWHPIPVFLPGECSWTEEPGRLQSTGSQLDTTEAT